MAQGRIRKSVEKSIKDGVDRGTIDLNRDAATIGMLRFMADNLDEDHGETPVFRYVTPASFLNYCEKLGFVPDIEKEEKKPRIDKNAKLHVVGKSRWKKQA